MQHSQSSVRSANESQRSSSDQRFEEDKEVESQLNSRQNSQFQKCPGTSFTYKEINDIVKAYYNESLNLEWKDIKTPKCDDLLRPLVPHFNAETGQVQQHFPMNYNPSIHNFQVENPVRSVETSQDLSRVKFFQQPLSELTDDDLVKMQQFLINNTLTQSYKQTVDQRGHPKITAAESLCLNVASDILTTDCSLHFHHSTQTGLERSPQFHNNLNHLQADIGSNLTLSLYNSFMQHAKTKASVYREQAMGAYDTLDKLTSGGNIFQADQKENFPTEQGKTFKETKFIQGVPVYPNIEHFKQVPGCEDLFKKDRHGCTIVQMINGMIGASTPNKVLQGGIMHGNALLMQKCWSNPLVNTDQSISYFADNLFSPTSVDMFHFVNLYVNAVSQTSLCNMIDGIQGSRIIKPLLVQEYNLDQTQVRKDYSNASLNLELQLKATHHKLLQIAKQEDLKTNTQANVKAVKELVFGVQYVWVNSEQQRVYDNLLAVVENNSDAVKYLSLYPARNKVKVTSDQKSPSLNTDKKVFGDYLTNVFCKDEQSKWFPDQPTSSQFRKNGGFAFISKNDVFANTIFQLNPSQIERRKYERLLMLLRANNPKAKDEDIYEKLMSFELERVQVFVSVTVPSTTAVQENNILKQLCLQRQFSSEQFRHISLHTTEQRRKLQQILGYKNQDSSEPLRNLLRQNEVERSVSKLSHEATLNQFKMITTVDHWKAHLTPKLKDLCEDLNQRRSSNITPRKSNASYVNQRDEEQLNHYDPAEKVLANFMSQRCQLLPQGAVKDLCNSQHAKLLRHELKEIEVGYFEPLLKLKMMQNSQTTINDKLVNSDKWKLELAVLLLPEEFFDSYVYSLNEEVNMDNLTFTENNIQGVVDFIRFVLKVIFNFLLQSGLAITAQDFYQIAIDRKLVLNFLKLYANVYVQDEADIKSVLELAFQAGFIEELAESQQYADSDMMLSNLSQLQLTRDKIRDKAIAIELISGRLSEGLANRYQHRQEQNQTYPTTATLGQNDTSSREVPKMNWGEQSVKKRQNIDDTLTERSQRSNSLTVRSELSLLNQSLNQINRVQSPSQTSRSLSINNQQQVVVDQQMQEERKNQQQVEQSQFQNSTATKLQQQLMKRQQEKNSEIDPLKPQGDLSQKRRRVDERFVLNQQQSSLPNQTRQPNYNGMPLGQIPIQPATSLTNNQAQESIQQTEQQELARQQQQRVVASQVQEVNQVNQSLPQVNGTGVQQATTAQPQVMTQPNQVQAAAGEHFVQVPVTVQSQTPVEFARLQAEIGAIQQQVASQSAQTAQLMQTMMNLIQTFQQQQQQNRGA